MQLLGSPPTVGVELEWQIIELDSYQLSSRSDSILNELKKLTHPGVFKPEITMGMIEYNSTIHISPKVLLEELNLIRSILNNEAKKINLGICGGGCHPFSNWQDQKVFPQEPFLSDLQDYGYLAKQFTVFGQHIHIGCTNDRVIYLCHAFTKFIPHFIALAASSPFFQSAETNFDSSRLTLINSFPFCGPIPWFENWNEFSKFTQNINELKMAKSAKDLFWDVRPNPQFNTIEIRVCDSPLTLERSADLAAYAQLLVYYLLDKPVDVSKENYFPYSYNKFNASKKGLKAAYIDPISHTAIPLIDDIRNTCLILEPYAEQLGSEVNLRNIKELIETRSNDSSWLRENYKKNNSYEKLVKEQINLWKDNLD